MPVDASLYAQFQPDIAGSVNKGMQLADSFKARKAQQAQEDEANKIKEGYNAGLVQNPDGSVTYDENKTLDYFAKNGLTQKYLSTKKELGDQAIEKQKQQAEINKLNLDYTGQAIGAIKANPANYSQIRADYILKTKADPASIPEQYDANWVNQTENSLLTAQQRQAQENANRDFTLKEKEFALKKREAEAKAKEKVVATPEAKLAKLNTSDKARYDNSKLGLEYVQKMDNALANGDNTFSLVGDNDFTNAQAYAAEAFGRMQSGGAINKDEEARFLRMAPRPTDSLKIQRSKLANQQKLFADRLNTLGFTPEEAGLSLKEISYGAEKQQPNQDMPTPEEIAAEIQRRGLKNAGSPKGGQGG
jgi:hypothetical protein